MPPTTEQKLENIEINSFDQESDLLEDMTNKESLFNNSSVTEALQLDQSIEGLPLSKVLGTAGRLISRSYVQGDEGWALRPDGTIELSRLSFNKGVFMPSFESIDGWSATIDNDGSITPQGGQVLLRGGSADGDDTIMYIESVNLLRGSTDQNPFLECWAYFNSEDSGDDSDIFIGIGDTTPLAGAGAGNRIGFEFNDTDDKFYAVVEDTTTGEVKTELTGISQTANHRYGIRVKDQGAVIEFWIDGVLEYVHRDSTFSIDSDQTVVLAIKSRAASNLPDLIVGNLFYGQDFS